MFDKFKMWWRVTFFGNRVLLNAILMELKNIHYHCDRMEIFYMMVNKIEEKEKK